MLKLAGIFFLALLFLITLNITFHYIKPVIAKESESNLNINDEEEGYNNNGKLVIVSNINLQNIEKQGFLKVVGVINGEDFVEDIPLDKLKDTTIKLKSQVYNKTATYYSMYSKPKLVSFDTLGQDTIESANSSSVDVKLDKLK